MEKKPDKKWFIDPENAKFPPAISEMLSGGISGSCGKKPVTCDQENIEKRKMRYIRHKHASWLTGSCLLPFENN